MSERTRNYTLTVEDRLNILAALSSNKQRLMTLKAEAQLAGNGDKVVYFEMRMRAMDEIAEKLL